MTTLVQAPPWGPMGSHGVPGVPSAQEDVEHVETMELSGEMQAIRWRSDGPGKFVFSPRKNMESFDDFPYSNHGSMDLFFGKFR